MCFFNAPATTEIYTYCHTLSLHDALPSSDPYIPPYLQDRGGYSGDYVPYVPPTDRYAPAPARRAQARSEEHTSELQSLMRSSYAVFCLNKKKNHKSQRQNTMHQWTTRSASRAQKTETHG